MAENLRVKKFKNGVALINAQSNDDWIKGESAFCIYDNNMSAPGLLYNWISIKDTNGLAPKGWHIPSDEEWKQLERAIGLSQTEAEKLAWRGFNEGDKLKVAAPQGWIRYGQVWGTDEYGFGALAGSCRLFNGVWGDPGLFATGFWWTSTSSSFNEAWYRYLDYKSSKIFRSHDNHNYGFSVRCVKN
jgi:uncharacterized protein (TIGR02145 family)